MGKKLCLGTFLNIMAQAKKRNTTQEKLFTKILNTVADYHSSDKDYQGHLKSGRDNLSNVSFIQAYSQSQKEGLIAGFDTNVIPLLDNSLTKQIVLAFKEVLSEDDVCENEIIGFEDGYQKSKILRSTMFDLAGLLGNFFFYCCAIVENKPYVASIKEVNKNKNYIHKFDNNIDDIIWIDKTTVSVSSPLQITAKVTDFTKTFEEVSSPNLPLKNHNQLKTFILDVSNNEFDYDNIKKFIQQNIGRYVFSRSKRNKYKVEDNIENLGLDAIKAYNKRVDSNKETNHFNEIMLYLFLECVLNAPKIYSKMELQTTVSDEYTSSSAGVHLLLLKNGPTTISQYVLGATDSLENLKEAIDSSFKQIEKLKDNRSKEYSLIESTFLNNSFDSETSKELEKIVLPQKSATSRKPEQAFGIFLGYTIDIADRDKLTPDEFTNAVKTKMEQDIQNLTPYIIDKIQNLNLIGNSFYIYILPFNNIEIDKEEIMKKALEV